MNKILQSLDWIITRTLMVLMLAIVLTVTWQVLSRYILQSPSSGSEELARFLLIWIGMLGAVYCYRNRAHLGLNILTNKMTAQGQLVAALVSHAMVFFFAVTTLIMGGFNLIDMAMSPVQTSAALGIKVAHVYAIVPLSGILFCVYDIAEIAELLEHGVVSEGEEHGS
ncbi:TRAP transporter small permease [Thalassotalea euphylliae]|nr:TRAP transporter small permease [Thalassotalea euphylliae]